MRTQDIRATIGGDEGFKFIEGSEEGDDTGFVAFLGASETGFVDASVDVGL